ncbi:MAG: hypothetical protein ACPGOY_18490 [Rhodospirillaceae bacterium]
MMNDDTDAMTDGTEIVDNAEAAAPETNAEEISTDDTLDVSFDSVDTDLESDADPEREDSEEEWDEDSSTMIELELGGTKHRIDRADMSDEAVEKVQGFAKSLHSDYTRKTQEVAEQRRHAKATQTELNALVGLNDDQLSLLANGRILNSKLMEMRSLLTEGLWQSNPNQARRLSDEISRTQAQFEAMQLEANLFEQQIQAAQSNIVENAIKQGKAKVLRSIKDFDEPALIEFAIENGIPEESARNWAQTPEVTILIHDAMRYRALTKQTTKAPTRTVKSTKPVKAIKGKGTAMPPMPGTAASDKLPIEQWMKLRNKMVHG